MISLKLQNLENIYCTGTLGIVAGNLLAGRPDPPFHFSNSLANPAAIQDRGFYPRTSFQNPEWYPFISIQGCESNLMSVFQNGELHPPVPLAARLGLIGSRWLGATIAMCPDPIRPYAFLQQKCPNCIGPVN
jgi:hypothetical protein